MNEEEVKAKIVLPFLETLGLTRQDLHFEDYFALQIGQNQVTVNNRKPRRGVVGGHVDILVKYGGKNLFILEIKESAHDFTEADRAQATSYARLVHPIAPYALLTNGSKSELLNAITRDPITIKDFEVKDGRHLVLPDADRYAAVEFFLGYSAENLLAFCRAQTTEQMKPLLGSPGELSKKYIAELTVPRADLLKALNAFEISAPNGFLVLADSGAGKTSALCEYVSGRLAAGKPTLFFSGATIEAGLDRVLAAELAWSFVEQLTAPVLLRRLCAITKDAPLIVVVDAIDEWTYSQKAQSLLSFLRGARDLRIKFVFSCKTSAWDLISKPRGSDIGFAQYLFSPASAAGLSPNYVLAPFSDEEFTRAITLYRHVFSLPLMLEDRVLTEARDNPFLLRVMFAVAAASQRPSLSFSSKEFFDKYFELVARQTGNPKMAEIQLVRLALAMFERNREVLTHEEVLAVLGLSASEAPFPALFDQNLLQYSSGGVAFYFQQLRSYLIAFRAFDWPNASGKDLASIRPDGVQGEAFGFYFRYATPPQLRELTGPVWDNLHRYRDTYARLIDDNFPGLTETLTRGEGSTIGFLAEYVVPRRSIGAYGFKRQAVSDSPVTLVPVAIPLGKSNLPALFGAEELHFTTATNGFFALNISDEVLKREIEPKIEKTLKERRLNLRGCDALVRERAVREISRNRNYFPAFFDSQGRMRFPISMTDVRSTLLRAKLTFQFEHDIYSQKRWSDRSAQWRFSPEERARIDAAVNLAMAGGKLPKPMARITNLEQLYDDLTRTTAFDSVAQIDNVPWWTDYFLFENLMRDRVKGIVLLNEYLTTFYLTFLDNYRSLVDYNFPTLASAFELRSMLPLRIYLEAHVDLSRRNGSGVNGTYTLVRERLPTGGANEVILCSPGELTTTWSLASYRGTSIPNARPSFSHRLADLMYFVGGQPLENMLYQQIASEWPKARDLLRTMVSLTRP